MEIPRLKMDPTLEVMMEQRHVGVRMFIRSVIIPQHQFEFLNKPIDFVFLQEFIMWEFPHSFMHPCTITINY